MSKEQHFAEIRFDTQSTEQGFDCDCVFAICQQTGEEAGPIWGQSSASVKRALATLSEQCDGSFHIAED